MATRKFDMSKATFEGQFNGFDGFDPGLPSGETQLIDKQVDYNLAAGLMYAYSPNEHNNFYVGGAGYNLLSPNISFFEGGVHKQYKRYIVVAGGEVRVGKKGWSLLPSVMFQKQGPNFEALFGTFVRYAMIQKKEEVFALDLGVWYRYNDAIIPALRVEYKSLVFTYNFDLNISKLTEASNMNGSQEISLVYSGKLFKTPKGHSSFKCPNMSF
jgi:type IX secretion system PorP/SprF family membrane protein